MDLMQVFSDFTAWENILGHLGYVLAIISMSMRTMHWLRVFAILSGLVAIVYFGFIRTDYVSAVWEFGYVAVNVVQLFLLWYENRIGQFDGPEREFVSHALMDLKPVHAARVVRHASHRTLPAGQVILTEHVMPEYLYYVVAGEVEVTRDGLPVGKCGRGDFLGEMSLLSGNPANATVSTVTPCQVLVFERASLENLIAKVESVRHALHAGISRNLLEKIGRMNESSVGMRLAPQT